MKYVYGPVPSRRLGQSLGIDPLPFKTCNWNCVYCQLGRTSPVINQRREFVPADDVVSEIAQALSRHVAGEIDWVTFVGSGEPTLHVRLGWMIQQVKSLTELPVAVITNGSLLQLPEVRRDLLAADAVLPSLDAGNRALFLRINRPHASLSFAQLVEGLTAFSGEYGGKLWVEVMLIRGLNDTEPALKELASVLRRIAPDEVHLNLPVRPPCEPWVEPADVDGQMRAVAILGDVARVIHPVAGEFDFTGFDDVVEAILAVITRHPMREEELAAALDRWSPEEVGDALARLRDSGRAQVVTRLGQRYWSGAGARYVDDELSRCHGGGPHDERQ